MGAAIFKKELDIISRSHDLLDFKRHIALRTEFRVTLIFYDFITLIFMIFYFDGFANGQIDKIS